MYVYDGKEMGMMLEMQACGDVMINIGKHVHEAI